LHFHHRLLRLYLVLCGNLALVQAHAGFLLLVFETLDAVVCSHAFSELKGKRINIPAGRSKITVCRNSAQEADDLCKPARMAVLTAAQPV
jgi:hypothetical protein